MEIGRLRAAHRRNQVEASLELEKNDAGGSGGDGGACSGGLETPEGSVSGAELGCGLEEGLRGVGGERG